MQHFGALDLLLPASTKPHLLATSLSTSLWKSSAQLRSLIRTINAVNLTLICFETHALAPVAPISASKGLFTPPLRGEMPLKRARSALDTASQLYTASSSSSANDNSSGSVSANTSQSEFKPAGFFKRRINGIVSALSPSNKRQKTNLQPEKHGQLLPTSSIMSSDRSSPTLPERRLLDLTPIELASAAAAADTRDTPSSLQSHEVAIRDPLGRTFKDSSPSTSSAVITDTRSSSEEAAETQVQQNTSPPSSPSLPLKTLEPSHDPESISTTATEPASCQAESETADTVTERAEATLPTDEDVEHIQAIADAKVGEHVEGLIDWNGQLSIDEPRLSSASSFDIDQATTDASRPVDKTASLHYPANNVVDLVSDSEESGSDKEDPDKENDMSLASTTPRLDSNSVLEPLASQDALTKQSHSSQSRYSLAGPMANKSLYRYRLDRQSTSEADSSLMSNGFGSADTSATDTMNSIGRQTRFVQPSRRSIQSGSTPLQPDRPSALDRSASFSSNVSTSSVMAPTGISHDLSYRKRAPIYSRKHFQQVTAHNQQIIKRSIEQALTRIHRYRLSRRKLDPVQKAELAAKAFMVHQLIAEDNVKDARGDILADLAQRHMRQRQRDAETAIMPLPQVKLLERERLRREEKAKLRKLRGILGRKELPDTLGVEEEQAATSVFSKRGVVSEITGAAVSDADVQKLRPRQWLNDEVINFYGALILNRANEADKKRTQAMVAAKDALAEADSKLAGKGGKGKPKRPYDESLDAFWRVHYFSSFFWSNLKSKGFDGVKRWTRRIDIFSKDLILFPINLGNAHWVCGVINMRKHRFEYYDSMGAHNQAAFHLMRTYLTEEARDKKKKEIDLRGWRDMFSDDSPQQENSYDCGVFAAQTLEQVSRRDPHTPIPLEAPRVTWKGESLDEGTGKLSIGGTQGDGGDDDEEEEYEWNFGQQNMPYLRRRMAYEIYSKKLLD